MNLGALLLAALDALQPLLDRWPVVLLAIVLVTLLGIPVRNLVGATAALLRVPAVFTRTDIDPVLHRAGPSSPNRLMRSLRDYFRPVLDRPARGLGTAAGGFHRRAVLDSLPPLPYPCRPCGGGGGGGPCRSVRALHWWRRAEMRPSCAAWR